MKRHKTILAFALCIILASCGGGSFEPIAYGKDACAHCRMTIMDARFAAEWISEKGKIFKFDDLRCAQEFKSEQGESGGKTFIADFGAAGSDFVGAEDAHVVRHSSISSPMGGGIVAFADEERAKRFADSLGTTATRLNGLR